MAATSVDFLKARNYIAVALTHFFVDVLNSGRNLLVAILAVSLGLTNAQVGIALILYNVGNALSQPLFGYLADRVGPRWLVVGGMGWMIFFFSLSALAGDWVSLIAITVASLGSGAFHPTGTMVASKVSLANRSKATAVFFMMGQMGLFVGPIITGLVLNALGRPGYLIVPVLALTAFLSGWQWVTNKEDSVAAVPRQTAVSAPVPTSRGRSSNILLYRAALIAAIIILNGTVSIATTSFAPKLFTEMGLDPGYVGWLSGLLFMGSALGGIVGGYLGDRVDGKWVILLGTVGTVLPIYFYIPATGLALSALLWLAGFFNGMPHTILVISIQGLLPNRRALASGLALGFMFFSGSVGSYLLGFIADRVGLAEALQGTAVLPIIAAFCALLLPRLRQN